MRELWCVTTKFNYLYWFDPAPWKRLSLLLNSLKERCCDWALIRGKSWGSFFYSYPKRRLENEVGWVWPNHYKTMVSYFLTLSYLISKLLLWFITCSSSLLFWLYFVLVIVIFYLFVKSFIIRKINLVHILLLLKPYSPPSLGLPYRSNNYF